MKRRREIGSCRATECRRNRQSERDREFHR